MKNRASAAIMAVVLSLTVLAGVSSTSAHPVGPTASSDIRPDVEAFVGELFGTLATNDASKWTPLFDERGLKAVPEMTFSDANVISIPSLTVDMNGDVNVFVVYSGLREPGGLFYDFLHLEIANGSFVVQGWENRLPSNG